MTENYDVQQLRDQLWQLRNEVAATDARAARAIVEAKRELETRLNHIEEQVSKHGTWIQNQQTRHSATPVWVFGVVGAITALVSTLVSLYTAGLI